MMNFPKKVLFIFTSAVLIILGFAAYRLLFHPDIEKIAALTSQNLNAIDTYSYETDLKLNAVIKADYSAELGFHIIMNTDVSETSNASHSLRTLDVSINNLPYAMTTEQYDVTENGVPVIYSCTNNIWTKEQGADYVKFDFKSLQRLLDMIADGSLPVNSYSVEKKVDGKKTYLMNVTVSGDVLKESISFQAEPLASSEAGLNDSIDWDNVSSDFEIFIYKDSLLPAMIDISFPELADLISENTFVGLEEYGLEGIELSGLSSCITFSNYGQPLDLTVPEYVIASISSDDSEEDSLSSILNYLGLTDSGTAETGYTELAPNNDGSYTITSPDTQASHTFVIPDYVSAEISADTTSVFAANEDYSVSYVYFFTGNTYDSKEAIVSALCDMTPYEGSDAEITNYPSVSTIQKEDEVTVITYSYKLNDNEIHKSTCYIVVPVENDYLILWIDKDQETLISEEEIETAVNDLFVLP